MIPLSSTRRAALPGLLALALAGPAALHAQGTSAARQDTVRATPAATAAAAPAAAPAGSVVTAVAGADGFGLRSADGSFVLRVKGGVQYDGRFFAEDQADALVNTFQIRRARSDFQGTLYRDYDFRVQLELSGTRVELLDAYVDARLHPALRVRAGKMKGPVGLERLLTPWEIPFNDRALPTSLVPNRETGVQVHGAVARGNLTYQLGFFNGTTDGASDDLDTSDGKDLAARVFATPFKTSGPSFLKGLGLGIAATTGSSEGTLAAPGLPSFRTGGRETFFRFRGDATEANTVVADGARRRVSPQGYWYVGPFGLLGEYVRVETEVRRAEDSRTLTNTAYNATASFVLTGEPASTKGVVPRRPLDPRGGGWGALELVARATGLEVDANTFPTFADPARSMRRATAYGAGVNWYLNRAVRALVNYERTSFDPADGAAARVDENVIVTRLQVYF